MLRPDGDEEARDRARRQPPAIRNEIAGAVAVDHIAEREHARRSRRDRAPHSKPIASAAPLSRPAAVAPHRQRSDHTVAATVSMVSAIWTL